MTPYHQRLEAGAYSATSSDNVSLTLRVDGKTVAKTTATTPKRKPKQTT